MCHNGEVLLSVNNMICACKYGKHFGSFGF